MNSPQKGVEKIYSFFLHSDKTDGGEMGNEMSM